jgi:hypothetical protein
MAGAERRGIPRVMDGGSEQLSPVEVRTDLTDRQYQDAFRALSVERALRLVEVCGYEVNSQARYSAIWEPAHVRVQALKVRSTGAASLRRAARTAPGARPARRTAKNGRVPSLWLPIPLPTGFRVTCQDNPVAGAPAGQGMGLPRQLRALAVGAAADPVGVPRTERGRTAWRWGFARTTNDTCWRSASLRCRWARANDPTSWPATHTSGVPNCSTAVLPLKRWARNQPHAGTDAGTDAGSALQPGTGRRSAGRTRPLRGRVYRSRAARVPRTGGRAECLCRVLA